MFALRHDGNESQPVDWPMTITIPIWLLWTLGAIVVIPLVGFVAVLAYIGWQMSKVFSK